MGNTSSSGGRGHHDESVDYGSLVPQGVYTGPRDWNHAVVSQLIIARKLAPFYRPLEDYEESWDDDQILAARKELPSNPENPDHSSRSESIHSMSSKSSSKRSVANREQGRPEAVVYRGAVECPICFLVPISWHLLLMTPASLRHLHSTIPPISTILDAATKQYAQSVSFRLNAMSLPQLISSQSRPRALIVFKIILVSFIVPHFGKLVLEVMDPSVCSCFSPGSLLTRVPPPPRLSLFLLPS